MAIRPLTDHEFRLEPTNAPIVDWTQNDLTNSIDNGDGTYSLNIPPELNLPIGSVKQRVRSLNGNPPSSILTNNEEFISLNIIYEKSNWDNFNDFTSPPDNFSISNGKIIAGQDPSFSKKLLLANNNTALDNFQLLVRYKCLLLGDYGLIIGLQSINVESPQNISTYFYIGTLVADASKKINLNSGTVNGNSPQTMPELPSVGDIIEHSLIFKNGIIYNNVKNITKDTQISWNFPNEYILSGGNYAVANTSAVYLQSVGAVSFEIESIRYSTNYSKNIPLLVGDSISKGFYAVSDQNRFATLLNIQSQTGGGDKTVDILNRIGEVINVLEPNQVFLFIGTNDIKIGVPQATIETNYSNYVNQLLSEGIDVVHITPGARNDVDVSLLASFILSTYTKTIDWFSQSKNTGLTTMKSIYDGGDGVHLNIVGNQDLADMIENSGYII